MYGSYSDPWAQVVVMLLAFVGAIVVLSIIAYVLGSLGLMKMFQKSGVEGWKAWVPFLSAYELFKLVWDVKFFGIMVGVGVLASVLGQGDNIILSIFSFLFGVAGLILSIVQAQLTAKAYGKGTGFAVGLFFVPFIMYLVLGFGDAKYQGNKYEHEIFGMKINF